MTMLGWVITIIILMFLTSTAFFLGLFLMARRTETVYWLHHDQGCLSELELRCNCSVQDRAHDL